MYHGEGNPLPSPENVFNSKTAVAVFLGVGPCGCVNYLRLIRSVSLDDDASVVRVKRPRSLEGTCGMLISSIHVVEFEEARAVRFAG